MNKLQQQFTEATRNIALNAEQKVLMRERLVEYMEYKPIRTATSATKKEVFGRIPLFTFFKAHHLSGALIIALTVTSSSFGVSFAADDALPGDLLYGVKVNINEEIKTALISSSDTASLVAWEQERAELRLVEASQLVAEGRLDSDKQEQVSKLFAEHTESIVEQVRAVEETDPVFAAEASSMLEDALDTHEAVLARLMVEQDDTPEEGARDLVSQVHTVAMEAEKIRENAEEIMAIDEAEVTVVVNSDTSKIVEGENTKKTESANMRERATYRAQERALELYESAKTFKANLDQDSELAGQAQAQINFGESLLEGGAQALEAHNLGDAYGKYRKASAAFQKVVQLLEVARLFSVEIYLDEEIPAEDIEGGETIPAVGQEQSETVAEIQAIRKEADEAIKTARKLLLTREGYEASVVDMANKQIKDAAALILRGEIAMVLESYGDAKVLCIKARDTASETVLTLEKATEEETVHEVEVPVKDVEPVEQEEKKELTIQHQYKDGAHVYKGTIQVPTPCTELTSNALVAESFPEQITLELATREAEIGTVCIQVLAEKEFMLEANASEQAVLKGVRVNGVEKIWSLVPFVEEKKSTSTFEMKTEDTAAGDTFFNRSFETTRSMLKQN